MLIYIVRFYFDLCENCILIVKYFRSLNICINSFEVLIWRFLILILVIVNSLYIFIFVLIFFVLMIVLYIMLFFYIDVS